MQLYEILACFCFGVFVIYRYNSTKNVNYKELEKVLTDNHFDKMGKATSTLTQTIKNNGEEIIDVEKTDGSVFFTVKKRNGDTDDYLITEKE